MINSYLIGIAGGSGSGKTTFLRSLLSHFDTGQVALVSQDDYYKPKHLQEKDSNGWINFDLPSAIDRQHFYNDVMQLSMGSAISKPEYNFNNPAWEPEQITIQPAPVILIEGLFVLHYTEIFDELQFKVYIEANQEDRLERRIKRDFEERGYPEAEVQYQWKNHVLPAEKKYLLPFRNECDLIINNNESFETGLQVMVGRIKNVLG